MKKINNSVDEKIESIRKYYKKNELVLELQLISYNNFNIYIRLDYFKKIKTYRLSWFDLDKLDINCIEKNISFEYIEEETIMIFYKIFDDVKEDEFYQEGISEGKVKFLFFSYNKLYNYTFYKYIPKRFEFLYDVFVIIFSALPKKLQYFLFELCAELTNDVIKYEYKNEFSFDLFNDDLEKIFANQIIERGKTYYKKKKVKFLEKIDKDRYFAIVEGTEKYLVVIKNDEVNKKVQVYCSCPCEFYCKHIYAVISAIRNGEFIRFYKISYRNSDLPLLDKVLSFNYQLCMGIVDDSFEIVNEEGDIELIPIFNSEGECNWQVIEDDEEMSLTKLLEDIIYKNS